MGTWKVFFTKSKSFIPPEEKIRKGKKKKSKFFMIKRPLLDGTHIGGDGLKVIAFLTTPLNWGETFSLREPRGSITPQTHGNVSFLETTNPIGLKYATH